MNGRDDFSLYRGLNTRPTRLIILHQLQGSNLLKCYMSLYHIARTGNFENNIDQTHRVFNILDEETDATNSQDAFMLVTWILGQKLLQVFEFRY